ncbi:GntR family transcriptional regulator [Actinopolyspora halophila]|uniref:GntR family transcriptional regulator n=1 Tax=Actinopolyspora halophila TaxID=1850 RepID=UPI000366EC7B|nr:GntR family transcriptional regulator [Actinopolyspora halophila]
MAPKRWERVYDALRRQIDEKYLAPGDALPTEQQLVDAHGVSRGTVRTALARLATHGLITDAHGPHGRTVREFAPLLWNLSTFEVGARRDDPDAGIDEWAADMREQGRRPAETVEVEPRLARRDIAEYLKLDGDEWLIRRRRHRYADDIPVSLADTWLPDDVAKLPAEYRDQRIYPFMEKRSISLPGGLIRAVGITQTHVEDLHYARMPTDEEAGLLAISIHEPVSEVVRIGHDHAGRRFRVMITVSPGHRMAARYVLSVKGAS